jgi:hypothetical protein
MADSWQKLAEEGLYDLQSPDIYFPMLLIDALNERDVRLSWGHDAAYASYRGWRSNEPYFSPSSPFRGRCPTIC